MPELPDVTAYISALASRIVGQPLEHVRLRNPFLLRTADPPLASVEGGVVRELRRIGKRIAIGVDGDLWLVLHLMIAGRLHWRAAGAKITGRNDLAAFDFPQAASSSPKPHGAARRTSCAAKRLAEIDPAASRCSRRSRGVSNALRVENRTLKRALTDPRIVSGIGNAYSDEILHAAGLSPIALTHKLTPEEWQRLYDATRTTLQLWVERLNAEAAIAHLDHVTAFRDDMSVHGRFGKPCPRCGEPVQRIRYADNETNYCPRCQTGGTLLADRSL